MGSWSWIKGEAGKRLNDVVKIADKTLEWAKQEVSGIPKKIPPIVLEKYEQAVQIVEKAQEKARRAARGVAGTMLKMVDSSIGRIENLLLKNTWIGNPKELLKDASNLAKLLEIIVPGPPPVWAVWAVLIKPIIEQQKTQKIKAIMDANPNKYSEEELNLLYKNNRPEFIRLFKLASDKSFRKYVREQADHKKAQDLILKMQERISEMNQGLEYMKTKEKNYGSDIALLKEEIKTYEDILSTWKAEVA